MRWTNCLIRHKSCDHVRFSPALLLTFTEALFSVWYFFERVPVFIFGESQQLPLALVSEKFALKLVSVLSVHVVFVCVKVVLALSVAPGLVIGPSRHPL